MMVNSQEVVEHYGTSSLLEQVDEALQHAGLGQGTLNWSDLVPLDQFHVRGLGATKELAEVLSLDSRTKILDVGCGLGGPARFLAATFGCHVTGVDLSQPFVEVASKLNERCGLRDLVTCQAADALNLPFPAEHFNVAWTQHVAMNVANRTKFYEEIHRVLTPHGRLAFYDVLAGDGRPLIFPVPWAQQPSTSFLLTLDATREVLRNAGFHEVYCADKTEQAMTWFAEVQSRLTASTPLSIAVVMGSQFLEMAKNLGRNLQEGRVRLVQAIFQRD